MGIVIDIVLIAIVLLSAFLGYKKGLVKLGAKLFAGIIAIVVTIIIYKPVANIVINNTPIQSKIENTILKNTPQLIEEDSELTNTIVESVQNEVLPAQVKEMSKSIVYAITAIVLFIVVKIVLSIAISFIDAVANLPILKQFNEVGGIIYGLVRGILIAGICILLMVVFININPESDLKNKIESSIITKNIYGNIVKF